MFALGCKPSPASPGKSSSFEGNFGWTCAFSTDCQDVFDFEIPAGSTLTIRVTNVSAGSASQIAMYGPGVALGGVNLLTNSTKELRCSTATDCDLFTAGEHRENVAITVTGTYRVAVTRAWGSSCDASGTYRLEVTSSTEIEAKGQTVDDKASAASGYECK